MKPTAWQWKKEHEHITVINFFFFPERALRQQTKKIYHQPANNKESRLDLDLVQKQRRLTTHHLCVTRDYSGSGPGYSRGPWSQHLSVIFPSVSNELPFFSRLQTLTEKFKCCKEIFFFSCLQFIKYLPCIKHPSCSNHWDSDGF